MSLRGAKLWRRVAPCVHAAFIAALLHCSRDYNPFADYANAGISITSQSIHDGDTVDIFTSETLQVIVTVKELTQQFSIHAEDNRLWSSADTTLDTSLFDREPFVFLFSFYDTGWHTIRIASQRRNGDSAVDTMELYVKTPLDQQNVVAYEGDSVWLKTPGVGDRDANYYWAFGGSAQYVSQVCSANVALSAAVFSGTGLLWVSDGQHESPVDSFTYSLADTTRPLIVCWNEGFAGKDTVLTGDTIFSFRTRITDGARVGIDSASINGGPFDGVSGGVYYKLFDDMHTHRDTNALALVVYALDQFQFGNESRDTFYVIFSDTVAASAGARIVVTTPSSDTTTTSADSFYVSGYVEKVALSELDLAVFLYVNGQPHSTARAISTSNNSWEWTIALPTGTNTIRLTAIDNQTSALLHEKNLVIVQNPSAPDTSSPRIIEVLADGSAADGQFTTRSSAVVNVRAFDEGVGIDTMTINGTAAAPQQGQSNWYQDTVALGHLPAGNEIVVRAVDANGNDTQVTVVVFRNRKPIVQYAPASANISADSLYADTVRAGDPDGDTLSFTKSSGPAGLTVDSESGGIFWTPGTADTGAKAVSIRVWDGYQPVYVTFTLHVYPAGSLPPGPLAFETQSEDFPQFLEAGKDTLSITLRVTANSGVGPFAFSAKLLDKDSVLLAASPDSVVRWSPDTADTGYQQLRVIVTDALSDADTLYPRVLVAPPNRAFVLSVTFAGDTLPNGALDINGKQDADTLVFRIADPDNHLLERHSVNILQWRTQSSTTIDSTVADTFSVVVDPAALDGYDTIIVTVTDHGGHVTTLKQTVYYGTPPDAPSPVSPANGSTIGGTVTMLTWTCSDIDGDSLWYDVYLGDVGGMTLQGTTGQTTYGASGLSPSTTYYWRIVAHDWKSQTQGAVVFFNTP